MLEKNVEQEKAIQCMDGPAILISIPGSGKTRTLLERIHHMVDSGIPASRILMVTFTRLAAKEMAEKYKRQYPADNNSTDGVTFSTIHALCLQILMTYGGYTTEAILKESESWYYLSKAAAEDPDIEDPSKAVSLFLTQYSAVRNKELAIDTFIPEGLTKRAFLNLKQQYENLKKRENKIDFDDMLVLAYQIMQDKKDVREFLQDRWSHVQVDEYQDTNILQKNVIYLLCGKHRNLCVAGDDDQSIYGFRGADPKIMLDFQKDFPDCKVFRIGTNYRCYPDILKRAATLIVKNGHRFDKEFHANQKGDANIRIFSVRNRPVMANALAQDIKRGSFAFDDIAVLYRNNQQAEIIASEFMKAGIPYQSSEKIPDSYEGWIWSDILAYYRLSNEERAENDLRRILNKPNRYLLEAYRSTGDHTRDGLIDSAYRVFPAGWKQDQAIKRIEQLFEHLDEMNGLPPEEFLDYLFQKAGYLKFLKKYYEEINDPDGYQETISVFLLDAKTQKTMREWLQMIRKRSFSLKSKTDHGVTLSTMHRSKGLEWGHVYIIDCNDGVTPSLKTEDLSTIEEERRLFYVAVTRAKRALTLYYTTDKLDKSRFLQEMSYRPRQKEKNPPVARANGERKQPLAPNKLFEHPVYGICMVQSETPDGFQILALQTKKTYFVRKKKKVDAKGGKT